MFYVGLSIWNDTEQLFSTGTTKSKETSCYPQGLPHKTKRNQKPTFFLQPHLQETYKEKKKKNGNMSDRSRPDSLVAPLLVVLGLLVSTTFTATAQPTLPTAATVPCPTNWTWNSFDDSCNIVYPNLTTRMGDVPSFVSFAQATEYCRSQNAALPVIIDLPTQLTFYRELVGMQSGRRWWVGVQLDPSVKNTSLQRWITATGRSTGFVFDWDTKRLMPNLYDRCVVMHEIGNYSKRVHGGNGKMLTVDCEQRHSVVCTKQRVPVKLEGFNDGLPRRIPFVHRTYDLNITFLGPRIPAGTLVTLQTLDPAQGLPLSQRTGTETHCKSVTDVTGVSTPFPLTVSNFWYNSTRTPSLCNGSCMSASIVIPKTWALQRGARYSFCFYVPLPFATPNNLPEYQFELLGSQAYLEVVQHDKDFLRDVCTRRTQDLQAVVAGGPVDSQLPVVSNPSPLDSPIEGVYGQQHLDNTHL